MSLRLTLLNAYLRNVVKPQLAKAQEAETLRRGLRRGAAILPQPPAEARFARAPHLSAFSERELSWWWCAAPSSDACAAARQSQPRAILFLHGGAFVAGSPETHRSLIWALAKAADTPVAALDYRLAPENPFPAGFEDAVAGFDALVAALGADARIALAGDSAGGGLAAALAAQLATRPDAAASPVALALFSPFVDLALAGRSLQRNARREAMLPTHRFAEAVETYLQGADPKDPRASPLYAEWPTPPPPTLIQASTDEALSDDAVRLADALKRAGGDVRREMWRGTPHAWHFFAPYVAESARAVHAAGLFLARWLRASEPYAQSDDAALADGD